ncbi:acyl-CoA thioesterase [Alkalimarinus sediminis]|uniref:Thioesterase family protein n=1 Tax=Alkalimarinus sediminis TaxID=1632866 RepID=A0A9E8KP55_9ALTE|nr:thioesterase family protein [Alkalimarinus sediminis]UZW73820.1 thioesterase family protein [Alkalimarinus sediminis]
MSRVKISFPEITHFSTELDVRIGDINQGNHLGHDRMITMIHEARIQFFRSLGYEELDIDGVGTLVADLAISYQNEAFYGDRLRFDISVQDISRKSCQFIYRVVKFSDSSTLNGDSVNTKTEKTKGEAVSGDMCGNHVKRDELIALAKTGVVFFDYAQRKSVAVPTGFIAQLEKQSS